MTSYLDILNLEFENLAGSFVHEMRMNWSWDQKKFLTLCEALLKAISNNDRTNQNITRLIWYCGTLVPNFMSFDDFKRKNPNVPHEKVKSLLINLGNAWFSDFEDVDFQKLKDSITEFELLKNGT